MKENKAPAFQWYPKDILTSARVAEMTLEEEGAYRRAIDFCWLNNSLPADDVRLAAIIGKGCSTVVASVVRQMFIPMPNDPTRLIHERLEEERQKQVDWREKSRQGGLKSSESRKNKSNGGSNMVQPPLQPNVNTSSSSSSSSPNSTSKDVGSDGLTEYKKVKTSDIAEVTKFLKNNKPKFPQPYMDYWNLFAVKYQKPIIKSLSDKRKKSLAVRLNEQKFDLVEILRAVTSQAFALEGSWFSFDWLIKNDTNYLKVLEGQYKQKPKTEEQPLNTIKKLDYEN